MRVSAWSNGDGVRGVRVRKRDRDEYFSGASRIKIHIRNGKTVKVRLRSSFWTTCPEIRNEAIASWVRARIREQDRKRDGNISLTQKIRRWYGRFDRWWEFGKPPKYELTPLGNDEFELAPIDYREGNDAKTD